MASASRPRSSSSAASTRESSPPLSRQICRFPGAARLATACRSAAAAMARQARRWIRSPAPGFASRSSARSALRRRLRDGFVVDDDPDAPYLVRRPAGSTVRPPRRTSRRRACTARLPVARGHRARSRSTAGRPTRRNRAAGRRGNRWRASTDEPACRRRRWRTCRWHSRRNVTRPAFISVTAVSTRTAARCARWCCRPAAVTRQPRRPPGRTRSTLLRAARRGRHAADQPRVAVPRQAKLTGKAAAASSACGCVRTGEPDREKTPMKKDTHEPLIRAV